MRSKKLRSGYSTGACAAAAAKAAALLLLNLSSETIEIPLPDKSRASFKVHKSKLVVSENSIMAQASVIKDAGDDPDITNGAEIRAEITVWRTTVSADFAPEQSAGAEKLIDYDKQDILARPDSSQSAGQECAPCQPNKSCDQIFQLISGCASEIMIKGGQGVGIVTKPGLPVPIGQAAINPVPRMMIHEAVLEALVEANEARKAKAPSTQVIVQHPFTLPLSPHGARETKEQKQYLLPPHRLGSLEASRLGGKEICNLVLFWLPGIPASQLPSLQGGGLRCGGELLPTHSTSVPGERNLIQVTISVPDGERLALKTLNPRLGIVGGISILGTTGLVKPISTEAWTATIKASMDVAKAVGCHTIVLSTGRTSETAHMKKYQYSEESYVMMGDYLEFSLLEARRHEFKHVHLCAQWAKMLKIALATPQTHVNHGAIDLHKALDLIINLQPGVVVAQQSFNTAREIFDLVNSSDSSHRRSLFSRLCDRTREYAQSITKEVTVSVHLVSYEGVIIAGHE